MPQYAVPFELKQCKCIMCCRGTIHGMVSSTHANFFCKIYGYVGGKTECHHFLTEPETCTAPISKNGSPKTKAVQSKHKTGDAGDRKPETVVKSMVDWLNSMARSRD